MAIDDKRLTDARRAGFGLGLLKGMGVTLKHLFKHNTVIQYPDEKQELPPRTRGVIALKEENCTVCMLCARECPDWCIYIDSHKETLPPKREGGRPRKRNVLDRFAIDYALCMYCGICVEVCPYDALFWSREFEYAEYDIRELTHEKERLSDWMASVLPPPPLEEGAELPGTPAPAASAATTAAPTRTATPSTTPSQTSSAAEGRAEQAADAPKAPTAAPTAAKSEAADEKSPAATATTQVEEGIAPDKAEAPATQSAEAEKMTSADSKTDAPAAASPPAAAPQRVDASTPGPSPAAAAPSAAGREDPAAAYERVLSEQRAKGSSPQVAEARAKVARVKAERGVRRQPTPVETDKRVPSAPTKGEAALPVAAGAPRAEEPQPEQGPVASTGAGDAPEPEAAGPEPEAAGPEPEAAAAPQPEAAAPEPVAAAPQPKSAALDAEDPDAAYERVLSEERAKGSGDAVATARAKAARIRAIKGTKGPEG